MLRGKIFKSVLAQLFSALLLVGIIPTAALAETPDGVMAPRPEQSEPFDSYGVDFYDDYYDSPYRYDENVYGEPAPIPIPKTGDDDVLLYMPEGHYVPINTLYYEKLGVTFEGTLYAINPGTYEAVATLPEGRIWEDGSTNPKTIQWTISKVNLQEDIIGRYVTGWPSYTGSPITLDHETDAVLSYLTLVSSGGAAAYYKTGSLYLGRDYIIEYKNNVDVGKATKTYKAIGPNTTGVRAVEFDIVPADINKADVSSIPTQYFKGKPVTPIPTVVLNGKQLINEKDFVCSYDANNQVGTGMLTISGKGNYKGRITKAFSIAAQSSNSVPMYRLYNPNSGEHFYTAAVGERDHLKKVGWRYEGIGWYAPKKSNTPVYRLYNKNAGDHHYTANKAERDMLVRLGWRYEGIGWYSDDAKTTPLYRQYNPNAKSGSHNYTTNKAENDMLVRVGWKAEGIGWYGLKH